MKTSPPLRRTTRALAATAAMAVLAGSAALAVLAGCAMTDPYQRPGVWRPFGTNEMNFELQVARAADLVTGRGTNDADADMAAAAVDRMKRDKSKPLPSSGISAVGAAGGAGGGGGGGAAAPGGGT